MRTIFGGVLLISLISCAYSGVLRTTENEETELVLVTVIFRHGARTTYSFYPNDPHKNEDFYPFGFGGLTNDGKLGEYKLGKYLRDLYGDFLGDDYVENELYVRSTDVTRTKMSAQLVLAGLFPPSEILTWNNELMWQPIPVNYHTDAEEDVFHPTSNCPYKKAILADLPNREDVKEKYIKPYEELNSYIQEHSGKSMKTPADMQDIFFNLKCESDMNYTLPEWTDSVFPEKIHDAASVVYSYHNYDQGVKKINSGYHLQKILNEYKNKINDQISPKERKIFLYSGHESTIGYMLDALQAEEPHIPPYGSALSFELHKKDENYFIKLQYRNDTEGMVPKVLSIPGCDVLCPFEKFLELQSDLLPTINIQKACNLENFMKDENTLRKIN